jgi:GTP cyclohydrolase I
MSRYLFELGIDPDDNAVLHDTPRRIVEGHIEMLSGYALDTSSLVSETIQGDHEGMVVIGDVAFVSLCEHHLLPFFGTVDVAYLPSSSGRVVGLSKIPRLVEAVSQRLQVQERMTSEIVGAMEEGFSPLGVLAIVRAEHLCVAARGVKARGSIITTTSSTGVLNRDRDRGREAMELIQGQRR